MALPLNIFKTITKVVSTSPVGIYTSPVGYSGVILLAQCTNVGANSQDITFSHQRTNNVGTISTTRILKNFPIPANDTANLLPGKLVLETNDVLLISGSNSTDLEFIVSILETLN
jgi:hypothetical protein